MNRLIGFAAAGLLFALSLALPASAGAAGTSPTTPVPHRSPHLVRDGGDQGGNANTSQTSDNGDNNGKQGGNNGSDGGGDQTENGSGDGGNNARLAVGFVSATNNVVTWRLSPTAGANISVWDAAAETCQAQGGAACGALTSGGSGSFAPGVHNGQALIVTQSFTTQNQSCKVVNNAEFAPGGSNKRTTVTGVYQCSGASTLGWPLLALLFAAGVAGAWWVHRRAARWTKR